MNDRTLCGIIKSGGKDCEEPVPPGAPLNLCLSHLKVAYLYVRDLIEDWRPEEAHFARPAPPEPTIVYYARFGDRIKIGTTSDLWKRMAKLPCDRLLATEPGGYDVERERHDQFRAFRLNFSSEWFRDCPEIRKHVNALRRQYGDPVENRYPRGADLPVLEDAPWEDPASWKPRTPRMG